MEETKDNVIQMPPQVPKGPSIEQVAQGLAPALGIKTPMGLQALYYFLQFAQIFDQKNQGYGTDNINRFAEYGVLVRLNDKQERIHQALRLGKEPEHDEKVADNWMDTSIYGLIGFLIRIGVWK